MALDQPMIPFDFDETFAEHPLYTLLSADPVRGDVMSLRSWKQNNSRQYSLNALFMPGTWRCFALVDTYF